MAEPQHGHAGASASTRLVTLQDVQAAQARIEGLVHRTPLLTCTSIDAIATERFASSRAGGLHDAPPPPPPPPPLKIQLAFKAEHLQKVGAFKARGATNAVRRLLETQTRLSASSPSEMCVVTHSSGNHAAAIAFAARSVGARAVIVMPENAPSVKQAAVAGYGARIALCPATLAARESTAAHEMEQERARGCTAVHFVHPYDDEDVIAGQGTLGVELVQQAQELVESGVWAPRAQGEPVVDIVVAPVGGGGMMSGVSAAVKGLDERIIVVGAEPELASDAHASHTTSKLHPALAPHSICDGLLTSLSARTLAHLAAHVDDVHIVSDAGALRALRLLWERAKQVVEPSAAVGLAAVLEQQPGRALALDPSGAAHAHGFEHTLQRARSAKRARGEDAGLIRIAVVLTGGNVEIGKVAERLAQEEEEVGRDSAAA